MTNEVCEKHQRSIATLVQRINGSKPQRQVHSHMGLAQAVPFSHHKSNDVSACKMRPPI